MKTTHVPWLVGGLLVVVSCGLTRGGGERTSRTSNADTPPGGVGASCSSDNDCMRVLYCDAFQECVRRPTSPQVLTQHNDKSRSGAQLHETELTPNNVTPQTFGYVGEMAIQGQSYSQPLYVDALVLGGGRTANILYVATQQNYVYAFDADSLALLWPRHLSKPYAYVASDDLNGFIGIMSTPVIDRARNAIYVAAREEGGGQVGGRYVLYALDLRTGESLRDPKTIEWPDFRGDIQVSRPALLLDHDRVYVAFGSYADRLPILSRGQVFAFDADTLELKMHFSTIQDPALCTDVRYMPNIGCLASIWQAGQGLAADDDGDVYFMTGNGSFSEDHKPPADCGTGCNLANTFIKLGQSGTVRDWYTPYNQAWMNAGDEDLGSAGVLLVPASSGVVQSDTLIGGGKEGKLYVMPTTGATTRAMGHYPRGGDTVFTEQITGDPGDHHIHGSPVRWKNHIYVWPELERLTRLDIVSQNGRTELANLAVGSVPPPPPATTCGWSSNDSFATEGMPGGELSISANGQTNGILWSTIQRSGDGAHMKVEGVLRAFDAESMQEIWNSDLPITDPCSRDHSTLGRFARFIPPTIANGRVYVPAENYDDQLGRIVVYGLQQRPPPPPPPPPVPRGGLCGTDTAPCASGTSCIADVTWGRQICGVLVGLGERCDDDEAGATQVCKEGSCVRGWCITTVYQGDACDQGHVCSNSVCLGGTCGCLDPKATCSAAECGQEDNGCGRSVLCGICGAGKRCVNNSCVSARCCPSGCRKGTVCDPSSCACEVPQ